MEFVLILSLTLDPFNTRSSLFWHFWMASRSLLDGSESLHLTQPRSWRPYLIFDVNTLSLIFNKAFWLMEFFNLLINLTILKFDYTLWSQIQIALTIWIPNSPFLMYLDEFGCLVFRWLLNVLYVQHLIAKYLTTSRVSRSV